MNASVWIIKKAFTVISLRLHCSAVLCSFKDSAVDFCNLEQYGSEDIIYSQRVNSGMWCCWDTAESAIDKARQQFLTQIKCVMLLCNIHVECVWTYFPAHIISLYVVYKYNTSEYSLRALLILTIAIRWSFSIYTVSQKFGHTLWIYMRMIAYLSRQCTVCFSSIRHAPISDKHFSMLPTLTAGRP